MFRHDLSANDVSADENCEIFSLFVVIVLEGYKKKQKRVSRLE